MKFMNNKNKYPDDIYYYDYVMWIFILEELLIITRKWLPESLINSYSVSAGVFYTMIKRYQGYREGFSYGAITTDFKRFVSTNNFVTKAFEYQVNQLNANTGKLIVILAHSFATIAKLNQLITIN